MLGAMASWWLATSSACPLSYPGALAAGGIEGEPFLAFWPRAKFPLSCSQPPIPIGPTTTSSFCAASLCSDELVSGGVLVAGSMSMSMGCVWFGRYGRVLGTVEIKTRAQPARIVQTCDFSPGLVPVILVVFWTTGVGSGWGSTVLVFFTGVGSGLLLFISTGFGSDLVSLVLIISTGVVSGFLLFLSTGFGYGEFVTYWVRSSCFTGHCSSLGSHPIGCEGILSLLAQSSVLSWPCLYHCFCDVCGCERHLFCHSTETIGHHHLTNFELSIKIGRLLVTRSCVIIWHFLDLLRSFGSRPGLWSWIPLCNPTR